MDVTESLPGMEMEKRRVFLTSVNVGWGLAGFTQQFWLCVSNNSKLWEHTDHSAR